MLTIRQSQIEALSLPLVQKLEAACLRYLRQSEIEPNIFQDVDGLRAKIRQLIEESRAFDFQKDESILEYVRICVRYQTDYSKLSASPKIRDLLHHPNFNQAEKLYLIETALNHP